MWKHCLKKEGYGLQWPLDRDSTLQISWFLKHDSDTHKWRKKLFPDDNWLGLELMNYLWKKEKQDITKQDMRSDRKYTRDTVELIDWNTQVLIEILGVQKKVNR